MQVEKTYLGDSVYAEFVDGMIKLTTENGLPGDPSNTIYLEGSVLVSLFSFVQRVNDLVFTNAGHGIDE